MNKLIKFFKKCKNIIRWFPIIWKDEDWDYIYIYEILKFKLKNQAKYIGERNFSLNAKRDAEIMNLCVSLINKIQNDEYYHEWYNYQKSDFNFTPMENSDLKQLEINIIEENYSEYFKKYPISFKKFSKNEQKERQIARSISKYNHEKAKKLLFKIIENNIEKWWD